MAGDGDGWCGVLVDPPYAVLDFNAFMGALAIESAHYRGGHAGIVGGGSSYLNYLHALVQDLGVIGVTLALLGAVMLFWTDLRAWLIVTLFPLLYFLYMGSYTVHFSRNMIVVLPLLALLAGAGISITARLISQRVSPGSSGVAGVATVTLLSLVLVASATQQGQIAMQQTRLVSLQDTRNLALEWIHTNIPPGSRVARDAYAPEMDPQKYQLKAIGLRQLVGLPLEQFDYVIVGSTADNRWIRQPDHFPREAAAYQRLFDEFPLVQRFVPDQQQSTGPEVRIYRGGRPARTQTTPDVS